MNPKKQTPRNHLIANLDKYSMRKVLSYYNPDQNYEKINIEKCKELLEEYSYKQIVYGLKIAGRKKMERTLK